MCQMERAFFEVFIGEGNSTPNPIDDGAHTSHNEQSIKFLVI